MQTKTTRHDLRVRATTAAVKRSSNLRRVPFSGVFAMMLLACAVIGCSKQPLLRGGTATAPKISVLRLGIANVTALQGDKVVLFDAGAPDTVDDVIEGLEELGIRKGDVSLIVCSHGHADHAGGGKELGRRLGAPVALGKADVDMAQKGHNRPLPPMRFFARMLRAFLGQTYPAYTPAIIVDGPLDLRPYGVAAKVEPFPGHTRGSLAIVLPDGRALVGDLMLGGAFGGAMCATSPGEHYYHEDRPQVRRNIAALLKRGVRRFYLGHGGPVEAADVQEALDDEEFGPVSPAKEVTPPAT